MSIDYRNFAYPKPPKTEKKAKKPIKGKNTSKQKKQKYPLK